MSQHVVPYQENEDADYDELEDDGDGEDTSNFHVMNRLPAPSAVMYRMEDLHKLMHIGEIDLDPPYQRDVVWPENKQIKLIDSLYHNYYIPPVVFTVFTVNDYEVRRCVDGKQRLTAIRKFIDGQIPYRDPVTRHSFWYTTSVPNRQEVPEVWKRDFANKLITSVEYRGLPDGLERDIFQRVQLGIPLTAAEKLQAHSSPWAQYISHLTSSFINSDSGLTNHIELDTSRGRDFQAIAQMVFCCDGLPEQRFPTAHKLDVWLQQTEPPKKAFKDAVKECLRVFRFVASTPGYDVGFKEVKNRVAPAEFVFIGVLIYVMRGCDHETIADAILAMRQDARAAYKDIRANTFVVKHLWGFISRKAEELDTGVYVESQGGKKGKGGKPIPRGKKRARKEEDEGRQAGESKKALTAQ